MFYKKLKENGFTLVEIMIAAGLMSVLALGVMSLMKQSTDSANYAEVRTEENELYRQISLILAQGDACKNTLQGKTSNASIQDIRNSNDLAIFSKNSMYGNNAILLNDIILKPSTGAFPAASSKGEVKIELTMTRKKIKPLKTIKKEILLTVTTDTVGAVANCAVSQDVIVEATTRNVCETAGGTWNLSNPLAPFCEYTSCATDTNSNIVSTACLNAKSLLKTGGTLTGPLQVQSNITVNGGQICVGANCRDFSAKSCPVGTVVNSIDGNGNLTCVTAAADPATTPTNCTGFSTNCSVTCGGGVQTFYVIQPATNGGTPCAQPNGATVACNTQACPPPVNCVGSWGACSKSPACGGGGTKTYTITQNASGGGNICPYANGTVDTTCADSLCQYNCPFQTTSGCYAYTSYYDNSVSCSPVYRWNCSTTNIAAYGNSNCTGAVMTVSSCTWRTQLASCPSTTPNTITTATCPGVLHTLPCTPI